MHHWLELTPSDLVDRCRSLLNKEGLILLESQGKRNPKLIEPLYESEIEKIKSHYTILNSGLICDDALNYRRFDLIKI